MPGGKTPPPPSGKVPAAPAVQAPLEVNEAKIVELQNRIQQLQREQLIAQSTLAQQNRVLGSTSDSQLTATPAAPSSTEHAEDAIREERKKRAYLSLFASNVALTYRKNTEHSPDKTFQTTPTPSNALP